MLNKARPANYWAGFYCFGIAEHPEQALRQEINLLINLDERLQSLSGKIPIVYTANTSGMKRWLAAAISAIERTGWRIGHLGMRPKPRWTCIMQSFHAAG